MESSLLPTWHVLMIDDDEEDYFITGGMLKEARGRKVKVDWVSTYEQGIQALNEHPYDVVLIDYDLGCKTGIDLIREMVAQGCKTPLILYTGRGSNEVDLEALEAGATMYLTKAEANSLLLERIIRYAIERKQAEEKIAQNEEHYRLLFSKMLNGFAQHEIILDEQGNPVDYRFLEINPAFEQITGLKAEQLVGKTVREVFPNQAPDNIELYGRVALTGEPVEIKKYIEPIQKHLYVHAFSTQKYQFALLFVDITGQVQAMQSRMESETRYQALADATFEGICISQNGRIIDVNEQMARMFGYEIHELVGQEIAMLAAPEDQARIQQNALKEREGIIEHVGQRKDGSRFLVEARAKMINYKDRHVRVTAVRDVTEQRRMIAALQESEERYSSLFNNHHTPMLLIDPQTAQIVDANPAACDFYGWEREEFTRKKITEINALSAEQVQQRMSQAETVDTHVKFTFPHRKANGEVMEVDVHSGPIIIGERRFLFSIIHDFNKHE